MIYIASEGGAQNAWKAAGLAIGLNIPQRLKVGAMIAKSEGS